MIKAKFWAFVTGFLFIPAIVALRSCTTESGETKRGFDGSVTKYEYGGFTYLIFKPSSYGGVAVVNYTKDSIDFEQFNKK